jgi:hypothetical protein
MRFDRIFNYFILYYLVEVKPMSHKRMQPGAFLLVEIPDEADPNVLGELEKLYNSDGNYCFDVIDRDLRRRLKLSSTFPLVEDEEDEPVDSTAAIDRYVRRFINKAVRFALLENASGIGDYIDEIIQDKFREVFAK